MTDSPDSQALSTASDQPSDTSLADTCPICRTAGVTDPVQCPHCHLPHHKDCWEYNGGCGTYGCPSAPAPQKLTDMEVPPSFWGQTEKACPACNNMIQAAALRCRFCGTVFSSTQPVQADDFRQQRSLEGDLSR